MVAAYGEEPADPPGARPFRSVEDLALRESFDFGDKDKDGGKPEDGGTAESESDVGTVKDRPTDRDGAGSDAATGTVSDSGTGTDTGTGTTSGSKDSAGPESPDPDPDSDPKAGEGTGATGWAGGALGSSVIFAPGQGPRDHTAPEPSEDDFDKDDEGHFVPPEPPPLPAADTTAKFAWLGALGGPLLLLFAVLLGWQMTWWLTALSIGGFLGGVATLVARMRDGDEDDEDPGRGAVV
ncbi:hypothetical protein HUT18_06090 [Streptomyces sp. NA04227]|nr:hypothetical protein [Streptomyces sp. NA04227]QKW10673.1 hypothetical protein HUT18_06090 [Streptomyces sp. NA04227]